MSLLLAHRKRDMRQLALAGALLLSLLLLLALGGFAVLRALDAEAWRDRQTTEAAAAARSVGESLERVEDAVGAIGAQEGSHLEDAPETLAELLRRHPEVLEIVRLDADGALLASATRDAPLLAEQFTARSSNWFTRARSGERYLGPPQILEEGLPYITLALPALDDGVVACRIGLDGLVESLAGGAQAGEAGAAYVIDAEGRLLAHPNPERVREEASLEGRPERDAILDAPDRRWMGSYESFTGREVVGASAKVPGIEGWLVLAEQSSEEALRLSQLAWRWLTGVMALLGIATLALLGWLVADLLAATKELRELGGLQGLRDRRETGKGQTGKVGNRKGEAGKGGTGKGALGAAPGSGAMEAGSPSLSEALAELEQTRPLDLREVQKLRDTFDEMYGRMQDLDRLKSEFLATISHELRTPLNSVIGYAELILSGVNGPIDEEMEKDVQAIYENGHQLLRLVNDLLDLAKIEAGHLELEMVRMDPVSLVEALYEDHLEAVEGKGLRLLRQSASDLPQIWGDPVRMQQIFANLISNSVKFTEEGYVRILARRQDNWVAIDVEDTGIGIARPDLDTIFERFRQLDGSLTRRAEGTGLGLAIGRHLVRMHGGRMVVDSTLGEGTTVTVFLPIAESPPNPTAVTIGTIL